MKHNTTCIVAVFSALVCIVQAGLLGFRYDPSAAVIAGTIDPTTGASTPIVTLSGYREFNDDHHAYNSQSKSVIFFATDASEESPYFFTIDTQKGTVLSKFEVPFGPVPYGFHYDGALYAQTFDPADNTTDFVSLNTNNGTVMNSFTYSTSTAGRLVYVSSAFDHTKKNYITSYLVMNDTMINGQSLVTVDVINKRVVSDVRVRVPDITNPFTNIHYNNNTNMLYGFMKNSATLATDVINITPTTGVFTYLNIINTTKYGDDLRSSTLDRQTNILYATFIVDEVPRLVTIDLGKKSIVGDVVMKGGALCDMLTTVY
jgi:uncharacterized UPF0146 family protein